MTAIFVHGAGCTPEAFAAQCAAFPDARAIALPGRCGIEGSPNAIGQFADYLLGELHGARAMLCGHSMGGAVVLECALREPDAVSAVVLLASGARLRVAPALFGDLQNDFPAAAAALAHRFFADPTPERVDAATRMLISVGQAQTVRDFRACDGFDATERLNQLRVPLLAITGAEDVLTPAKYGRFLADRVPDGAARIIEGAGHFAMVERADETNALLASFVARMEP